MNNNNKRYFVDIRGGCAAVRDSEHPDYDSEYQGLHQDTNDVIEYRHGFKNSETNSWDMKKEDVDYLNNLCEKLNGTELRAITYCYTQDGILHNKLVGIFTREQLDEAMDDIRKGFGYDREVKTDKYDSSCDNYFLEYLDEQNSYFYSSNYTLGELIL